MLANASLMQIKRSRVLKILNLKRPRNHTLVVTHYDTWGLQCKQIAEILIAMQAVQRLSSKTHLSQLLKIVLMLQPCSQQRMRSSAVPKADFFFSLSHQQTEICSAEVKSFLKRRRPETCQPSNDARVIQMPNADMPAMSLGCMPHTRRRKLCPPRQCLPAATKQRTGSNEAPMQVVCRAAQKRDKGIDALPTRPPPILCCIA